MRDEIRPSDKILSPSAIIFEAYIHPGMDVPRTRRKKERHGAEVRVMKPNFGSAADSVHDDFLRNK